MVKGKRCPACGFFTLFDTTIGAICTNCGMIRCAQCGIVVPHTERCIYCAASLIVEKEG